MKFAFVFLVQMVMYGHQYTTVSLLWKTKYLQSRFVPKIMSGSIILLHCAICGIYQSAMSYELINGIEEKVTLILSGLI